MLLLSYPYIATNSKVIYKTKSDDNIYIEEIDAKFVSELRLLAVQHTTPIIYIEDEDIYWGLIYSGMLSFIF